LPGDRIICRNAPVAGRPQSAGIERRSGSLIERNRVHAAQITHRCRVASTRDAGDRRMSFDQLGDI